MAECAHPSCPRQVPANKLSCLRHWMALPGDLRREVSGAWRDVLTGQPDADARHSTAKRSAIEYWRSDDASLSDL